MSCFFWRGPSASTYVRNAESTSWAKHGSRSIHFTIWEGLMWHRRHLMRLPQLLRHARAKSIDLSYWLEPPRGGYKELLAPVLISMGAKPRGAKPRGANSRMWKRCVVWELAMEQTRKIGHNLMTLHPCQRVTPTIQATWWLLMMPFC